MTQVQWGKTQDLWYEAGLDRGVLFVTNEESGHILGVPWDGLTSFQEEADTSEASPIFVDGRKINSRSSTIQDFKATLSAFTFPKEFEPHQGLGEYAGGLAGYDQKVIPFGLSFRTRIFGEGSQPLGYRIHILFNVTAKLEPLNRESVNQQTNISDFHWVLNAVPTETIAEYQQTSYIILDSREIDAELLGIFEEMLYGSDVQDPTLLSIDNFITIAASLATIVITDNGDGTWTASADDRYISMLDGTTFQIQDVDGVYLNPDTYEVSTTFHFDL